MRRGRNNELVYWEPTTGGVGHDPDTQIGPVILGPGRAAPMVDVDLEGIRVSGHHGEFSVELNRGAARWLGLRLIEAAALQEVLIDHEGDGP